MKLRKTVLVLTAFAAAVAFPPATSAADAAPDPASEAIRRELSEPFCYLRFPTEQIGFEGNPNACIVTSDGAFLSPFGQLSFYAGEPKSLRPVSQRVKTLLEDCLPVIRFGFDRDGLHYQFEAFATPADLDQRGNLITFVECTVSNAGQSAQAGSLGANFGDIASEINFDPATDWFKSQRGELKNKFAEQRSNPWHPKRFLDETRFNAGKQEVSFDQGRMMQGGHLVFTAPADGARPGMPGYENKFKEAAVQYDFTLGPGEKRSFRFRMPAVPVAWSRQEAVREVLEADHDKIRARTIAYWKDRLARADHFSVDDPKVMATLKTSLVNDLIPREASEGDRIYQRVNRIQYNHFWVRDGSFFVRSYDMMGLHDVARETLNAFFVWRDGKPVSFYKPGAPQPPDARLEVQEDYWGEVLWAVGAHYRAVKDRDLLEQVYPLLGTHIDEFTAMCKADPRGLWPKAGPYDAEVLKDGHYTGHSFWALMGLRYAVYLAKEMGRGDDARKWQKVHDDYEANFLKQLREIAARSEGFIPPGMDSVNEGNDWDNNTAGLYPFEVLAKDDPLVRKTLETVRDFNYLEGIIAYGANAWMTKQNRKAGTPSPRHMPHHYLTFSVSQGNTILGEQRKVIEDLYSILAHTGSTNSGFEFLHTPWTREPYGNFAPHGWFHSCYMAQIRNLLVREEGTEIHLASALAPRWVRAGKQVKVTEAPTFFGPVSYLLDCRQDGATLTLANRWKEAPTAVVLHIPIWFLKDVSASVDGKTVAIAGDAVTLLPDVARVELHWTRGEEPSLSYEEAVRLFLEKFHRKPVDATERFLFPLPGPRGK
jgi:hypothetical protein